MINIEELLGRNNSFVLEELKYISNADINFAELKDKTVLVIGDSYSINEFFTLTMLFRNDMYSDNIRVISVGHGVKQYNRDDLMELEDFFEGFEEISKGSIDYIIYLSSNDVLRFKAIPGSSLEKDKMLVSSMMALALKKGARVLFVSPFEVYGAVHNGFKPIKESDVGYISPNNCENLVGLSARFGETLAYSLSKEKDIPVIFARIPTVYGSRSGDTGILACGSEIEAEIYRIIVSSVKGHTYLPPLPDEKMSIIYITDCIRALIFLLLNGGDRETYNVTFDKNITTFREISNTADKLCGRTPSFGQAEESSYMTQCRILDGTKLLELGFKSALTLEQGIGGTLMKLKTRSEASE